MHRCPRGLSGQKSEHDILGARIPELRNAAATGEGELGIVGRAVELLKARFAAGKDRVHTDEAWSCETMDKISKLQALLEEPDRSVGGERARVAGLVDAELVSVAPVINKALSGSEGMVSEEICDVHDGFPVNWSSDAPDPSVIGLSDQACVSFGV